MTDQSFRKRQNTVLLLFAALQIGCLFLPWHHFYYYFDSNNHLVKMGYETPFAIILGAAFAGMFLNAFLGNRMSTIIINPLIIAGVIVLFLLLITARRYGGPSHIKLGYGFLATLMNVLATAFLTFKMGLSKKSPSEPNDLLDEPNSLRDPD